MKEIYSAFIKAQSEMGHAVKDGTNPHFRSGYATLPQVLDVVLDALNKNGIAVLQKPTICEDGAVSIETTLIHGSGEAIDCGKAVAWPKDRGPQAIGSVVTYLRRYSIMSICGIGQIDDDAELGEGRKTEKSFVVAGQKAEKPVDSGLSFWSNKLTSAMNIKDLDAIGAKIGQDETLTRNQTDTLKKIYIEKKSQLKQLLEEK